MITLIERTCKCGTKFVGNRNQCKRCRAKWLTDYRIKLLAKGICPRCGKNPVSPNSKRCEICKDKSSEYAKTKRDAIPAGICKIINCGKPNTNGKVTCEHHSRLNAFYIKKWKLKRFKNGYCVRCGQRPIEQGIYKCNPCLVYDRERSKKYRASIPPGMCKNSGCKRTPVPGLTQCAEHKEANKLYKRKVRAEIKRRQIIERQVADIK